MRISDWSSDVCSSDLQAQFVDQCKVASHLIKYRINQQRLAVDFIGKQVGVGGRGGVEQLPENHSVPPLKLFSKRCIERPFIVIVMQGLDLRSEEHTSELQSLMRISYAVFCLKKKNKYNTKSIQDLLIQITDTNDR